VRPPEPIESSAIDFAIRLVRGVGQRCRRGGYVGAFLMYCRPPARSSPTVFACDLAEFGNLPVVEASDAGSPAEMLRRICAALGNGVRVTNAGWQRAIIDMAHAWRDHDAPCVVMVIRGVGPMPRPFRDAAAMLARTARMPLIVLGDDVPAEAGIPIIDLETDDDRADLARSLFRGTYSEDAA
jgi:hypothetical protein